MSKSFVLLNDFDSSEDIIVKKLTETTIRLPSSGRVNSLNTKITVLLLSLSVFSLLPFVNKVFLFISRKRLY